MDNLQKEKKTENNNQNISRGMHCNSTSLENVDFPLMLSIVKETETAGKKKQLKHAF